MPWSEEVEVWRECVGVTGATDIVVLGCLKEMFLPEEDLRGVVALRDGEEELPREDGGVFMLDEDV